MVRYVIHASYGTEGLADHLERLSFLNSRPKQRTRTHSSELVIPYPVQFFFLVGNLSTKVMNLRYLVVKPVL